MVSADVMAITKWSIWARKKAALRGVATRRLMTTSATKLPPWGDPGATALRRGWRPPSRLL